MVNLKVVRTHCGVVVHLTSQGMPNIDVSKIVAIEGRGSELRTYISNAKYAVPCRFIQETTTRVFLSLTTSIFKPFLTTCRGSIL